MRFLRWNMVFAVWLLVSAFFLTQTPISSGITFVAAIAIAGLSIAAGGKPALRYLISLLTVALGFAALLLPGVSGAARINLAIVAAIVFALSLVSPTHGHTTNPA